ncbi:MULTISPECIES: hypothetical protein [unclassified Streptococcus]|uniref:hypothetical protein n=1 Tax=unclassified Streptococcus TaxID=2608887 RepID=UPI0010723629|nr:MULTISPECIES: hypothetical protein [unclassified Streptococcus]MBF0787429.1 hypothetical protein [Streptococcus sp. 19428wC2_LYSM12]MCQ9211746.1 hypothetical protein [Streptococcus sp. B01]MCQ9213065.1 hypothetical protein [Streptococcus sp. O1]TFV05650.1 hypothetical protein E4T79_05930 [Streptococcus sp. LYSM12]
MKSIYFLMFKKRWYLFGLLALITLSMNLFLWNEASQLIRVYPMLEMMKTEGDKGSYEMYYNPPVTTGGLVTEPSKEERTILYQIVAPYVDQLATHKIEYFQGGELVPMTDNDLQVALLSEELPPLFFDDLLVHDLNEIDYQQLSAAICDSHFPVTIQPIRERYQIQKNYYLKNFFFGAIVSLILFLFGNLIVAWLIGATLKICQEELAVLRLIGLTQKQLYYYTTGLFLIPMFVGLFLFFLLVWTMGVGLILADALYLSAVNSLLLGFTYFLTCYRLKGALQ